MNIFFLFIMFASAAPIKNFELKVESSKFNYTISISEKKFRYFSATKQVQQKIQPCGSKAYELFVNKIKKTIKNDYSKTSAESPNLIQVTFNKEIYFFAPLTLSGNLFSKIENDIDYLISEAIYRCSKK